MLLMAGMPRESQGARLGSETNKQTNKQISVSEINSRHSRMGQFPVVSLWGGWGVSLSWGDKSLTFELLPERVTVQSCDEITQSHFVDVEFQVD